MICTIPLLSWTAHSDSEYILSTICHSAETEKIAFRYYSLAKINLYSDNIYIARLYVCFWTMVSLQSFETLPAFPLFRTNSCILIVLHHSLPCVQLADRWFYFFQGRRNIHIFYNGSLRICPQWLRADFWTIILPVENLRNVFFPFLTDF